MSAAAAGGHRCATPRYPSQANRCGRPQPQKGGWSNWDEALAAVSNPALVDFYRAHLNDKDNWPSQPRSRFLAFPVGNSADSRCRRVQDMLTFDRLVRFDGDMEFWGTRLGPNVRLDPVAAGKAVRFFLDKPDEFNAFWRAFREEIPGKAFYDEPPFDVELEAKGQGKPTTER